MEFLQFECLELVFEVFEVSRGNNTEGRGIKHPSSPLFRVDDDPKALAQEKGLDIDYRLFFGKIVIQPGR